MEMIVEHLGDGAYVTLNRDFPGQVILTANHHEPALATDIIEMDTKLVGRLVTLIKRGEDE